MERNQALAQLRWIIVWRSAIITLLIAPLPVALVSLKGQYLTEEWITVLIASSMVGGMLVRYASNISYTKAMWIWMSTEAVLPVFAVSLWLITRDVFLVVVLTGVLEVLCEIYGTVHVNKMTELIKQDFELDKLQNDKIFAVSAAGLVGQGLTFGFYYYTDIEPIIVFLWMLCVFAIPQIVMELQRFRCMKELGYLNSESNLMKDIHQ